ncbi:MAG: hypothetical protein ABJN69_06515 [Hellea sp.]
MKRLALMTIAAAGITFAATPSFAQSSYGGNTGQSYGNAEKIERKAKKAAARAEKKRMKAAKMKAEQEARLAAEEAAMKDQSSATNAKMMKDHSSATDANMMKDHSSATTGKLMDKKPMMADHSSATNAGMMKDGDVMVKDNKAMMAAPETMKPTNCPAGTTPQSNGTCMLN